MFLENCSVHTEAGTQFACLENMTASMCQANFSGDALYQQHLNGPIHKKALAKEEARRLRDLQMGASRGAAESAMVCQFAGAPGLHSCNAEYSQAEYSTAHLIDITCIRVAGGSSLGEWRQPQCTRGQFTRPAHTTSPSRAGVL
jgi:hypothetical protein